MLRGFVIREFGVSGEEEEGAPLGENENGSDLMHIRGVLGENS